MNQRTPAEATGSEAEDGQTPVTPDANQTGTPEGAPDSNLSSFDTELDSLKYSERTYQANREQALAEGRALALTERNATEEARRQRLLERVTDSDASPAPVIRQVKSALKNLSSDLSDDEMEPVVKVVRDVRSALESAAFDIVANDYKDAIDASLGGPDKASAFWQHAEGVSPTLDVPTVLRLHAEAVAMTTDAVKKAKPEDLIAANPALKVYFNEQKDKWVAEGREYGRTDPEGDPTAEGRSRTPSVTPGSLKGRTPEQIADDLRDPARRAALATAVKGARR